MKNIWYLEDVNLFKVLCPHKFADFSSDHLLKKYDKNDFVFLPNDRAQTIYLVAKGKIKVGYYDNAGEERVKAILSKGELLGEKAILGMNHHTDFAQVIENNTEVCIANVDTMKDLIKANSDFSLSIYKRIGWRIAKLERQIEILLFKDARTRLVEFLKDLVAERGQSTDNGILIEHDYTQKNMASLIGASRKTVSLLLNEMETEDLIEMSRKKIIVKDVKKLAATTTESM